MCLTREIVFFEKLPERPERLVYDTEFDTVELGVKRHVAVQVHADLLSVRPRDLLQQPLLYKSHRSVNMLVIYRETRWLPAMEPIDSPNRATIAKSREKVFSSFVLLNLIQFCSPRHEVS